MTNKTKPTAGAMRAAAVIQFEHPPKEIWDVTEKVARIIDRETGLPELLAALEFYADAANWGPDDWGVKAVIQPEYNDPGATARAALAKAKGGSSEKA